MAKEKRHVTLSASLLYTETSPARRPKLHRWQEGKSQLGTSWRIAGVCPCTAPHSGMRQPHRRSPLTATMHPHEPPSRRELRLAAHCRNQLCDTHCPRSTCEPPAPPWRAARSPPWPRARRCSLTRAPRWPLPWPRSGARLVEVRMGGAYWLTLLNSGRVSLDWAAKMANSGTSVATGSVICFACCLGLSCVSSAYSAWIKLL